MFGPLLRELFLVRPSHDGSSVSLRSIFGFEPLNRLLVLLFAPLGFHLCSVTLFLRVPGIHPKAYSSEGQPSHHNDISDGRDGGNSCHLTSRSHTAFANIPRYS